MAAPDWRDFPPVPPPVKAVRGPKAMLVGILGPPGSGKTRSVLEMMRGVQRVYPGPAVLIDTEAGRSNLFTPNEGEAARPDDPIEPTFDYERIVLEPPYRSDRCWAAVQEARKRKPAAIGFDNISDEHLGEGGYLEFHDAQVDQMGGNEYGAWAKPAILRKRLISGLTHILPPPVVFLTFISEEKTAQVEERDERSGRLKKKIIKAGWTPVAPLLILKALDLTIILPWDAKGSPIWQARQLPNEDFMRKWPEQLVRIMKAGRLTPDHGEALARWAKGETVPAAQEAPAQAAAKPASPPANSSTEGARRNELVERLRAVVGPIRSKEQREDLYQRHFLQPTWAAVTKLPPDALAAGLESMERELSGLAAMQAEIKPEEPEPAPTREPGED